MNWRRREKTVASHVGWPVPQVAKLVPATELASLVAEARRSGFSRIAKGVTVHDGWSYFLLPVMPEPSPSASWICTVVAVEPAPGDSPRPGLHYGRLDVAVGRFRRLSDAPVAERDQLLHWVVGQTPKADQP